MDRIWQLAELKYFRFANCQMRFHVCLCAVPLFVML